ncbi:hypothetical protein JCM8547_007224 [Rhodosporidiobolus lusitaniae]
MTTATADAPLSPGLVLVGGNQAREVTSTVQQSTEQLGTSLVYASHEHFRMLFLLIAPASEDSSNIAVDMLEQLQQLESKAQLRAQHCGLEFPIGLF